MSDKAEAAWEAWLMSDACNRTYWPMTDGSYKDLMFYLRSACLAGYTAATADCEAKVRAAVEATIEEAAKATIDQYRLYVTAAQRVFKFSQRYATELQSDANAIDACTMYIRALDASAIVAHIMGKEEGAE